MKHINRWMILVLMAIAGLQLSACTRNPPTPNASEPAEVEHIEGTGLSRVTLTARAAERLNIQTTPVREEQVIRTRRVVGEVVGKASVDTSSGLFVRAPLTESDLNKVDRGQPALVFPLTGDDEATGVVAQAVEASACDAVYYLVDSAEHGLAPGQRVLVELSLLGSGTQQKVVPYASVIYDLHGETWVYKTGEPLTFVRHPITVDYIDGDMAVLSEGPPVGTEIVTVGVIELWGAETGVGGHTSVSPDLAASSSQEVSASQTPDDQAAGSEEAYTVDIYPPDFVAVIDNAYFPLIPGAKYVYEAEKIGEGLERVELEILSEKREVVGIQATIMRSTTYLDGQLMEDNNLLFVQDKDGNVWYFGEIVKAYENGQLVKNAGGWEAGVDGALPGIIMYADPAAHIGETYRLEYYPCWAEDMAELVSVTESITIPNGSFENVVQTLNSTPLEPYALEHKFYAEGVGMIKGVDLNTGDEVFLVEFTDPYGQPVSFSVEEHPPVSD